MCSQGFNRYPNDILKLSFSYVGGVISILKGYLWKGGGALLRGEIWSFNLSPLLMFIQHLKDYLFVCMCLCENILTSMCLWTHLFSQGGQKRASGVLLYHFLPITLRQGLSLKPRTHVFLISLEASKLQWSSSALSSGS